MSYITALEAAKWISGITIPLSSDVEQILNDLIATVDEAINAYTETRFDGPQVLANERHDCGRNDIVLFENWPCISVQQVVANVNADGSGGSVIPATEYNYDDAELRFRFQHMPLQRGYLRIDYTWGYAAVPARVKQAAKLGVEAYWRHRARQGVGITSKSKEGESISYRGAWDALSGLPKEATSLLADFRYCEWPAGARGELATRRT